MSRGKTLRYRADTAPEAEEWLAADEEERIDAVSRFHRLKGLPTGDAPEAHATMHVIVENQLALDNPPEARAALDRLQREGLDRHEAVHAIASVLAIATAKALHNEAFDLASYCAQLELLGAESWSSGFAHLPKKAAALAIRYGSTKDRRAADAAIQNAPEADAVSALQAIAERDEIDAADDDEEPLSFRAIELLGKRRSTAAVNALLEMLRRFPDDIDDMRPDRVIFALQASGAVALEPVLAAFDEDALIRDAMSEVLSEIGVRDERIFTRLCGYVSENPFLAGIALGRYGDERAIPILREVIDALPLNDPMHTASELAHAIEDLGGELTPAEKRKVATNRSRQTGRQARQLRELRQLTGEERVRPVVAADRPGRNDPCHCGSGKKYKKCHLDADEAKARES